MHTLQGRARAGAAQTAAGLLRLPSRSAIGVGHFVFRLSLRSGVWLSRHLSPHGLSGVGSCCGAGAERVVRYGECFDYGVDLNGAFYGVDLYGAPHARARAGAAQTIKGKTRPLLINRP